MSIETESTDVAIHTVIHRLHREQTPARLSAIMVVLAQAEVSKTEREVDRALQRLRKRGILEFKPRHGWICRSFMQQVTPAIDIDGPTKRKGKGQPSPKRSK